MALQLVPLSPARRAVIAPASVAFDQRMMVGGTTDADVGRPISVDPGATAMALAILAAMALAFWSTRSVLQHHGVRRLARSIATLALVTAPIAIVHHIGLVMPLDALWPPTRRDLRPWGPFMNRNDFAGWLVLTLGVALGYLVARLQARHKSTEPFDPERAFDETGTRIVVSICVATAAVMMSLSRSGVLGVAVGLTLFLLLARTRLPRRRLRGLTISLVVLLLAAALVANFSALSARLEIAVSEGLGGRWSIWQQTWPVVKDFWPVGSGVGAYARVMTLYQTSTRLITIAHADDELLQVLAEGGALVAVPVGLLIVSFAALVARRLHEDRTPVFWIRAGAAAGVAAIAAQNLVEMTLRVPAIGFLFVTVAGIAAHDRARPADVHGERRHDAADE